MLDRISINTPENYIKRVAGFFRIDGSFRAAICALISTAVSALLAYHLLVIYGHGNADAVCEGLVCYDSASADWALACGRWLTRYMNALSGGLIMPGVWVALYMVCVFVAVITLTRLWNIKSPVSVSLMAALMAVNPTVIEQSLLQYMFMAWGLSNLLSVLFVYLNCQEDRRMLIPAALCMPIAFGLYQSAVGAMCLCFCITLVLKLFDGMELREMFRLVLRFAATSIIGVALYFAVLRAEIARFGVAESGRVRDFSIRGIFAALGESVPDAYRSFFEYFADPIFRRGLWYLVLAVMLLALIAAAAVRLLRQRRGAELAFALALVLLMPAFANIAKLIFPYNTTVTIMEYQNILMLPFLFALAERTLLRRISAVNLARICAYALALVLCWTYIVSANATYRSYELTYSHMNFMTASILNDIYNLPDYEQDDTIAFAGFVQDDYLRESFSSYKYAYGMYDNLAFWIEPLGIRTSRHNYLLNYFGIESGYVFAMGYNNAVQSEEFKNMPVYPGTGAIRKFDDDLIIVKLSEQPPIFE